MSLVVSALTAKEEAGLVLELVSEVRSGFMDLREGRLDFSALHKSIMQLEKVIGSHDQNEAGIKAVLEQINPEIVSSLQDAYSFWQADLEYGFAQRLGKGEVSLADFPLNGQFAALTRRELAMVPGPRPERILFMGSGPLPISAIHLHRQTMCPVDCLAVDAGMADSARAAVESCGLQKGVRILSGEDGDCDLSEYDLILVALMARRKKAILKMLRKRCRLGCRILCRTSHGLWQIVHEVLQERDIRGFHLRASQQAPDKQRISTWLLEAARSAAADAQLEWIGEIDSTRAAQLLRLINRTLEEETTIGFPGPIDEETGRALMCQLNEDVRSGRRHVLVACKDGDIVGQLVLTPNSSPNHRHIVELTRGTIHPSFRGGGLALRAFAEIVRKCEELGREVICLDVRAGTHAAIWWLHFGFKQYGLLSDYSRVGDKKYQGLYLTQTTAELKQRVLNLANLAQEHHARSSNAGQAPGNSSGR